MLESKLNLSRLHEYAAEFSRKITEAYFTKQQPIKGPQLLQLAPVQQVNLFVIKILSLKWKEEFSKLKSPYFNYEAPQVQAALKQFMNTLSKEILVQKQDLEPLLTQATRQCLLLVFSPYDYYQDEIQEQGEIGISPEKLREIKKYVKINDKLLSAYIQKLEEKEGEKEVNAERAIDLLNEVFEEINEPPVDVEPYLEQFNAFLPLTLEMIYAEAEPTSQTINEEKQATEEVESNTSGSDTSTAAAEVEKGASPSSPPFKAKTKQTEEEIKTLNEKFKKEDKTNLSEIHQKKRIESIKRHISINQKFMFTKELFLGDKEAFQEAIEELDQCQTMKEAEQKIDEHLMPQYSWDKESEEYLELYELIQKKYG